MLGLFINPASMIRFAIRKGKFVSVLSGNHTYEVVCLGAHTSKQHFDINLNMCVQNGNENRIEKKKKTFASCKFT